MYKAYKIEIMKYLKENCFSSFPRTFDAVDIPSIIKSSGLKPGEYINVKSNKYSAIDGNILSSIDLSPCTYKFNQYLV